MDKIDFAKINQMMKEDSAKYPEDNWDNYLDMLEDIKTHANANGGAIFSEDRPMQLKLAYRCANTGKTWACKITNLKKTIDELRKNNENEKADLLVKAHSTVEGKENLLKVINSQ